MAAYAEGLNVIANADIGKREHEIDAETTPLRDPQYYPYDIEIADVAEVWRRGSVIASWLLDLTAAALQESPTLDEFGGRVSDSGEGRWTLHAAIDEGVPAPVLSTALYERFASRNEDEFANKLLSAMRKQFGGHDEKPARGGAVEHQRDARPCRRLPPTPARAAIPDPHVIVLFGASGDLAARKLLPGFFHLEGAGLLPDEYRIVGTATDDLDDDGFVEHAHEAIDGVRAHRSRRRGLGALRGAALLRPDRCRGRGAGGRRRSAREEIGADSRLLHYLAVPPAAFESIIATLGEVRPERTRGAGDPREAVRPRLRLGGRAQRDAPPGVRRLADLPDRPLPRQGGGPEHPRAALRERPLRAALEPQQRRVRPDRRPGDPLDRPPRRLLRGNRRLPRHGRHPPAAAAQLHRDGAARGAVADCAARREDEGDAGDADDRSRRRSSAASTRATSTSRASPRTRRPRPSSRSRSRSTTGAGRAFPSTCGPASAWPSRGTWSRSTSASRRCGCSRTRPSIRAPTSSSSSSPSRARSRPTSRRRCRGRRWSSAPARMIFHYDAVLLDRQPARGLRAADPRRDARRRDPVHERRGNRAALGDQRRRARASGPIHAYPQGSWGPEAAQELIAPNRWRLPEAGNKDDKS